MKITEEMERAAFEACAAIICNAMCAGDDPTCACHMAVREALKAALADAPTHTEVCKNEMCPRGGKPIEVLD